MIELESLLRRLQTSLSQGLSHDNVANRLQGRNNTKPKRQSTKAQRQARQIVLNNASSTEIPAPGTDTKKIKWGTSVKQRLREHRKQIKEWLDVLFTVAKFCDEEQQEIKRRRRSDAQRSSRQQSRVPSDPPGGKQAA